MDKLSIMLATRDDSLVDRLTDVLGPSYDLRAVVGSCRETLEFLVDNDIDLIMFDPDLKKLDGLDLLQIIKKMHPEISMVVISDDASYETGVKIAKAGVVYNMPKPIDDNTTRQVVKSVAEKIIRKE